MSKMMLVLVMTACAVASAGSAAAGQCETGVSASGRAANPMNFDPPQHYDMDKVARSRAIAAWRAAVQQGCPGFSSKWERAHGRNLLCEGYAGGQTCQATAAPAHG